MVFNYSCSFNINLLLLLFTLDPFLKIKITP